MECQENTSLPQGELSSVFIQENEESTVDSFISWLCLSWYAPLSTEAENWIFPCRMMSTESANSFTLIGDASDGGTMENLSRRLKVMSASTYLKF